MNYPVQLSPILQIVSRTDSKTYWIKKGDRSRYLWLEYPDDGSNQVEVDQLSLPEDDQELPKLQPVG